MESGPYFIAMGARIEGKKRYTNPVPHPRSLQKAKICL